MAEPQPPQVREGADFEEEAPAAQGSADARKAAAALSSLDARGDEDESGGRKANLDQEALGKAMSRLEVNSKKPEEKGEKGKVADLAERKVAVKVDQADVALLVSLIRRPG